MTTSTNLVPSPPQARTDHGVGASSAAAAVGMSDYRTRLDAWLEATGRVAPFLGNERTRWGQVLEPVIRAHYVELHGATVHVPPASLFHAEHPFIRATPDGIVLDPATEKWSWVGPQVKNIGLRMAPAWADGAVPTDYLIQGVVEMSVTALPRIDFAVLVGGQHYEERTLWFDAELEADVIEQLVDFWRMVETNTQPEIDESRAFKSHILKQIKRKAVVAASSSAVADLERWREVVVAIAKLKREEAVIKNRVVAELAAANANKLTSPLGDVTVGAPWKKTAWKEVAHAARPVLASVPAIERELAGLRAEAVEVGGTVGGALVQRIDALRAPLRLFSTFEEIVEANSNEHDPRINRPRAWTKDVGDDEGEEH